MSLRVLRRHCHFPTAAALIGVLLYTALIASHIVSQAAHRAPLSQVADIQNHDAGDPGCHEGPSPASNDHPGPNLPASPAKCPFCTGYAALHISVAGGYMDVLPFEPFDRSFASLGRHQLVYSGSLPSWHPRAPPVFG